MAWSLNAVASTGADTRRTRILPVCTWNQSGGLSLGRQSASFRQKPQAAIQAPLHRDGRDAKHPGGLGLRHPLDPHQAKCFPLVVRQVIDRLQHAAAVRAQPGTGAGRRRHQPFAQLHDGRLFI